MAFLAQYRLYPKEGYISTATPLYSHFDGSDDRILWVEEYLDMRSGDLMKISPFLLGKA